MLHLHAEGLVHRDLAARNVLVGEGFEVKISDFGLSRPAFGGSQHTNNPIGPVRWMAPECIGESKYSKKSDVWAFGVTAWEVITRDVPYKNLTLPQVVVGVVNETIQLEIPSSCPPILAQIMNLCWNRNPELRPSFADIVSLLKSWEI